MPFSLNTRKHKTLFYFIALYLKMYHQHYFFVSEKRNSIKTPTVRVPKLPEKEYHGS